MTRKRSSFSGRRLEPLLLSWRRPLRDVTLAARPGASFQGTQEWGRRSSAPRRHSSLATPFLSTPHTHVAARLPAPLRTARLGQLTLVLRGPKPHPRRVAAARALLRLAGAAVPVTGDRAGPSAPGHLGTCGDAMSADNMLSTQHVL